MHVYLHFLCVWKIQKQNGQIQCKHNVNWQKDLVYLSIWMKISRVFLPGTGHPKVETNYHRNYVWSVIKITLANEWAVNWYRFELLLDINDWLSCLLVYFSIDKLFEPWNYVRKGYRLLQWLDTMDKTRDTHKRGSFLSW